MPILDKASEDIFSVVISYYAALESNPVETATAALAAIAGEQLVRYAVPPGSIDSKTVWVFNEKAEEILFLRERDTLNIIIGAAALASGLPFEMLPDMGEILDRTDAAIRSGSAFPPLTIPRDAYPAEWPANCAFRHRAQVDFILDENKLQGEQRVLASAMAVAKMVKISADMTGELRHFLVVALEVLAGSARMAPLKEEVPSKW